MRQPFEHPPQMTLEYDTATFTWWHTDGTQCPRDCPDHDWSSEPMTKAGPGRRRGLIRYLLHRFRR